MTATTPALTETTQEGHALRTWTVEYRGLHWIVTESLTGGYMFSDGIDDDVRRPTLDEAVDEIVDIIDDLHRHRAWAVSWRTA